MHDTAPIRVLVVDDYQPWHDFVSTSLEKRPELHIVGHTFDGLDGVQQAQQLQPDLILLDIGLPSLNGIEAARRIREASPASKILFVSENRAVDVAEEALNTGADGYVVKSDAANELLLAVEAILKGEGFVSASLGRSPSRHPRTQTGVKAPITVEIARRHEVAFYSDGLQLLDDVTQFIGGALKVGNAAIVAATEAHRVTLLSRLRVYDADVDAAIEQGRYIALDAAEALSTFMVNGIPDTVRCMDAFGKLILTAAKATKQKHPRVAIFGEYAHLLWAEGNSDAAIQMEKLGNKISKLHDVHILCGYCLGGVEGGLDNDIYQRICAEHSAVYSR